MAKNSFRTCLMASRKLLETSFYVMIHLLLLFLLSSLIAVCLFGLVGVVCMFVSVRKFFSSSVKE